jgi:hypothetical protein
MIFIPFYIEKTAYSTTGSVPTLSYLTYCTAYKSNLQLLLVKMPTAEKQAGMSL